MNSETESGPQTPLGGGAADTASQNRTRFEDLPPAAQRALKEAEERRLKLDAEAKDNPREINGRDGPEPTRYGDWERKGVAVDF